MALLQSGEVSTKNKLTIPEGYTVKQIADRVAETGICTAEEFITEANTGTFPHSFLKDLPDREYRLEGYLFPDTYFLTENMTAHEIISMMLDRFEQMYTQEYQDAVAASGHTLDEIVTLSLIHIFKAYCTADGNPTDNMLFKCNFAYRKYFGSI